MPDTCIHVDVIVDINKQCHPLHTLQLSSSSESLPDHSYEESALPPPSEYNKHNDHIKSISLEIHNAFSKCALDRNHHAPPPPLPSPLYHAMAGHIILLVAAMVLTNVDSCLGSLTLQAISLSIPMKNICNIINIIIVNLTMLHRSFVVR